MIIGIVGSEGKKFIPETEILARSIIRTILSGHYYQGHDVTEMSSGHCHLGGIDIYAEEIAASLNLPMRIFPPKKLTWEGGYKQRNIEIARASDEVYCITLDKLPPSYKGMTFNSCYHCKKNDHVKSGGCWTTKFARQLGKKGETIVINTSQLY